MQIETQLALGVYSDASADGVDISLIQTDGMDIYQKKQTLSRSYPNEIKEKIFSLVSSNDFSQSQGMQEADRLITEFHENVIQEFLVSIRKENLKPDVIGYSGHTIYHNPQEKINIALGNSDYLAKRFKTPVISRFIQTDFAAGGTGGPLFAPFFDALTRSFEKPLAIISIGGIASAHYIGPLGELQSFDIGIGTALLDRWIHQKTGAEMDFDGQWGAKGNVDDRLLTRLLKQNYLQKTPPKSIGRNDLENLYEHVIGSDTATGAATLTVFLAESIVESQKFFPDHPKQWILTGGGTFNPTLLRMIRRKLKEPIQTAAELGWDKDTLGATAYAFLAIRSLNQLPISYPTTTGVSEPVTGGTIFRSSQDNCVKP